MVALSSHKFQSQVTEKYIWNSDIFSTCQAHGSTEFWSSHTQQVIAKCTTGQDFSRSVSSWEIDSITSSEYGFDSQNLASHLIEP